VLGDDHAAHAVGHEDRRLVVGGQLVAYALNARVERHLVDRRRVPTRPGKVEGDRRVARPF